ncbi:hypothetical protein M514_20472 [Trichuris suis]|uniref:Uncharacterized protein n=1 Tax=Trichuris suis TaxID=68888 RepID=A0A085ND90_9BILA|nr:hypothetical protein M514_20472 [Trichuris suis]
MQCALMHCKTESGLQEVRSTDELMRLSGKIVDSSQGRFKHETLENEVAIDCQHALFLVTHSWKRLNDHTTTTTAKRNAEHAINDIPDENGTI